MTYLGTKKKDGTIERLDHLGIKSIEPGQKGYKQGYKFVRNGKYYRTIESARK